MGNKVCVVVVVAMLYSVVPCLLSCALFCYFALYCGKLCNAVLCCVRLQYVAICCAMLRYVRYYQVYFM